MKIQKNQTHNTIALFLILIFAVSTLTIAPAAFAQTKIATKAFAFANPQLLGKGQTVWLVGWVSPPTGSGNLKYQNLTLIITKPDGTTANKFFAFADVGEFGRLR